MILLVALVQLVDGAVTIRGDSVCPRPDEVASRLRKLLPTSALGSEAVLVLTERELVVRLQNYDGIVAGEGSLPVGDSCDDMALAAAVMIAAWHAQLSRAAGVPDLSLRHFETKPPRAPEWELRLAPLLSLAPGQPAIGGAASVSIGFSDCRWTLELGLAGEARRALVVGPGVGSWYRLGVQMGPSWAPVDEVVRVQLGVSALATLLSAEGQGFTTNRQVSAMELGVGSALTVSLPAWAVYPFVSAAACYWPGAQRLRALGVVEAVNVPPFEARFAIGLAWSSR